MGGRFTGNCIAEFGILTLSRQFELYLGNEFADPTDVDARIIDLGETIYENTHGPLDDYLRGRPTGGQRLGIHTGEPYPITDEWSGSFSGLVCADPARSNF